MVIRVTMVSINIMLIVSITGHLSSDSVEMPMYHMFIIRGFYLLTAV